MIVTYGFTARCGHVRTMRLPTSEISEAVKVIERAEMGLCQSCLLKRLRFKHRRPRLPRKTLVQRAAGARLHCPDCGPFAGFLMEQAFEDGENRRCVECGLRYCVAHADMDLVYS